MEKMKISFTLNGKPCQVEVKPHQRLLDMLRDDLRLTGTKEGCGIGECGACTVIMDGKAVTACLVPAPAVDGRNVVTIEGVGCDGKLDPVQEAVLENHALQCGFCTPGVIMSAVEILESGKEYTREELRKLLSGHLCRCTGYENILNAVQKTMYKRLGKTEN